jgi:hypothetical protein
MPNLFGITNAKPVPYKFRNTDYMCMRRCTCLLVGRRRTCVRRNSFVITSVRASHTCDNVARGWGAYTDARRGEMGWRILQNSHVSVHDVITIHDDTCCAISVESHRSSWCDLVTSNELAWLVRIKGYRHFFSFFLLSLVVSALLVILEFLPPYEARGALNRLNELATTRRVRNPLLCKCRSVPSWRTWLPGWITHHFDVDLFLHP